jgi:hypothetical protein
MIPLYLSGEGAEEIVEHKVGVTKTLIHEHEESAEVSLVLVELTAALALSWIFAKRFKDQICHYLEKIVLVMSLLALVLVAQTAHLGGMIRHDEIRKDQLAAIKGSEGSEGSEESEGNEKD